MKISTEKPRCWDRLKKRFDLQWESGIIITYDGVIHTKSGRIEPDYLAHELVHVKQQEGWDPDEYLDRFLSDKEFRFEKEIPAYRVQIAFLRATILDPHELFNRIENLAEKMARNYADMITLREAKILLLQ